MEVIFNIDDYVIENKSFSFVYFNLDFETIKSSLFCSFQ